MSESPHWTYCSDPESDDEGFHAIDELHEYLIAYEFVDSNTIHLEHFCPDDEFVNHVQYCAHIANVFKRSFHYVIVQVRSALSMEQVVRKKYAHLEHIHDGERCDMFDTRTGLTLRKVKKDIEKLAGRYCCYVNRSHLQYEPDDVHFAIYPGDRDVRTVHISVPDA